MGIIIVLECEILLFYNCIEPFQLEAKNMEELAMCWKINQVFPKIALKRCSIC